MSVYRRRGSSRLRVSAFVLVALLGVACATPASPQRPGAERDVATSLRTKQVTIGVTGMVNAMSIMGASVVLGGWHTVNDVHSAGLITSDFTTQKPIGRLAERPPTLDDGTIAMLPDGRMRVEFRLRPEITWQDGTPFSAQDLVFTHRLLSDSGIPSSLRPVIPLIDAVEAPNDQVFVIYYKGAYYRGGTLGVREFWPQPRHLLQPAYERYLASQNADEFVNLPYWTSEYVHLGPFRLTAFEPGEGMTFAAYPGYFLGRPKLDVIRVRTFDDPSVLFTNLLAGTVDLHTDLALSSDLGYQLKQLWESSGEGTVYVRQGVTRMLAPQWRSGVQIEPAIFDPRVRSALYRAIDREAFAERDVPAWSLLPPGDALYEATRDSFRIYPYEPDRARAILREIGWTTDADGALRNTTDGRRFRTAISVPVGAFAAEMPIYASYWRSIGIEVDEHAVSGALLRNEEARSLYPGWEASSSGPGESVIGRLDGPAASAQTRWVGNRGGYEDPQADALLRRYRTSLSDRDQFEAMQALSQFVTNELPILVTYFIGDHVGKRKRLQALDDIAGGANPGAPPFGTYTRNAHLWDVID
jgi:peptide/nickel transport system substrate-binding protein